MGWLGWTPEVALAADVNAIIMALEGRKELLSMIFGSGKPDAQQSTQKPRGATVDQYKSMTAGHNARWRRKGAVKSNGK